MTKKEFKERFPHVGKIIRYFIKPWSPVNSRGIEWRRIRIEILSPIGVVEVGVWRYRGFVDDTHAHVIYTCCFLKDGFTESWDRTLQYYTAHEMFRAIFKAKRFGEDKYRAKVWYSTSDKDWTLTINRSSASRRIRDKDTISKAVAFVNEEMPEGIFWDWVVERNLLPRVAWD